MILITEEDEPAQLTLTLDSMERQLGRLRQALESVQDSIEQDQPEGIKDAGKLLGEIRQWLRLAIEAEIKLNDRKRSEKGIARDYALDFDAARTSIGGRLDRLRRAGCPRVVSRQSD